MKEKRIYGCDNILIRIAELTDAPNIAKVNIDTWKNTYQGIVSDEYLNNLSYEQREQAIKNIINIDNDKKFVYVAEDNRDGVIGFISCGKERENDKIYAGEIYAVYILKKFQNLGIGKLLFNCAIEILEEDNLIPIIVWALEENKYACNFYEVMGGRKIKERYIHIGNQKIKEVAYGFV